jgi:hypothetical protein
LKLPWAGGGNSAATIFQVWVVLERLWPQVVVNLGRDPAEPFGRNKMLARCTASRESLEELEGILHSMAADVAGTDDVLERVRPLPLPLRGRPSWRNESEVVGQLNTTRRQAGQEYAVIGATPEGSLQVLLASHALHRRDQELHGSIFQEQQPQQADDQRATLDLETFAGRFF